MLLQPATVLMMLLRRQYVRIEQWLREQVAAQRIPGLRWLLRRYRLMKPRLVVLEKILRGLRSKRTSLRSDKKTRHTAAGNVAGTAD
jgi:hypothetical protein